MSDKNKRTVLIIGASGMLGHSIFYFLMQNKCLSVFGSVRDESKVWLFPKYMQSEIIPGINAENNDSVIQLMKTVRPEIVINCAGIIKQSDALDDVASTISVNSTLPHRLANLCQIQGSRLIHISTDCVFLGNKGMYTEEDVPDSRDLYGLSKLMGEPVGTSSMTIRTSIIGRGLNANQSLIDWFLSQSKQVKGYCKAIFSGLPTVEIARVIQDHIIPNDSLNGLYHLSANPINKFDLLQLVARVYGKSISIIPNDELIIDRSLDSSKFRSVTGYEPDSWPELIRKMHSFRVQDGE